MLNPVLKGRVYCFYSIAKFAIPEIESYNEKITPSNFLFANTGTRFRR